MECVKCRKTIDAEHPATKMEEGWVHDACSDIPLFNIKGAAMTTDEIVEHLNKIETEPVTWFKVKEGTVSWRTDPVGISSVEIIEACRDSGGPLKCRECGREVLRSEPEIHYIEDGKCDCKECHDHCIAELQLEDEDDTDPEYTPCPECGCLVGLDESSCAACGMAFEQDGVLV